MTKPIEDDNNAAAFRQELGLPAAVPSAAGNALLTAATEAAQRTALGLGNVNNTSDADKPVSTAQATALSTKMNATLPALQSVFDSGTPAQKEAFQSSVSGDASGIVAQLNAAATAVAGGDSITVGANASPGISWIEKIAAEFTLLVTNTAVSGSVLQNSNDASGAPRTNNGRDIYPGNMTGASKKDFAILAWGFNDARYVGAPATFNAAQYEGDYNQIVSGLLIAGYRRDQILIVTPHYITDNGLSTGTTGFVGQTRVGFEDHVVAAARVAYDHGVWLADTYSAMRDGGGAALISGDGYHPNDAGHAVIFAAVKAASKNNIIPAPGTPRARKSAASTLAVDFLPALVGGVATHEIEVALATTLAWGSRQSTSSPGATFGALADGNYHARVRSNYGSGRYSPWAYTLAPVAIDSAAASTTFAADTFAGEADGTPLTAHAQTTGGGSWTVQPGYVPAVAPKITAAGTLYSTDTASAYRLAAAPSANHYVEATLKCLTVLAPDNIGIYVRGGGDNTMYCARISGGNTWSLLKLVSGASTVLGTFTSALVAGTSRTLRIEVVGSTITVKLDGTAIITVTDTAISSAGYVGIRWAASQSATTGTHLDAISAGAL